MAGILKSIIGATGIGPVSNILQRNTAKGLNKLDRRKIEKLLSKISENSGKISDAQKEVSSRSSFLKRDVRHFFDGNNKEKLKNAEDIVRNLRRSNISKNETVSNLNKGINSRNENIQKLLAEYPTQLGNTAALYSSGLLGAGTYGAAKLTNEDTRDDVKKYLQNLM